MKVLVSGSIAYDRIMDFPGKFSDHIVPEKIHMINVSFTVNSLIEKFGGTAGNIAYALRLQGESPVILATIGKDYDRYFQWLKENDVPTTCIRVVEEEFTAGAYITTDQADNQITGFNPGAMKHEATLNVDDFDPKESMAVVAPGNIRDMLNFAGAYKSKGIPYVFDPGQAIPALSGENLKQGISGSRLLIANDYEMELITRKVETDVQGLLSMTQAVITTKGEQGSTVTTKEGDTDITAVPPKAVKDPTGAGDAFRAGMIKGLIGRKELTHCAMLGSACAAYVVEVHGTQEYRYTPQQFEERFQAHYGQPVG